MIQDLDAHDADPALVDCDVAVIGAGIAGIVAAAALTRRGLRTVVLESGGTHQDGETHELNEVVQAGQRYDGASAGRFRCLGGTSTRWGGAMVPFQPADLDAHTAGWSAAWPVRIADLLAYLPEIERRFALPAGPYELTDAVARRDGDPGPGPGEPDFLVRAAKWPPFRLRNVARVFDEELRAPGGPLVWLNANVTALRLDEGGRLRDIQARSPGGRMLQARAREVIVAAGAIESTRLLLQMDADHGGRLFAPHDVIGRHFHDHLSAPVAQVEVLQPREFRRLFGFRFEGASMRNTRFELSAAARRRGRLPGAFAHVKFVTDGRTGFDGLREVLQAAQRHSAPAQADMALVARNAGWFARAAWSRLVERRVLPPDEAVHELHLVTEQRPVARNRITLSGERHDRFGLPLAVLDWQVQDDDLEATAQVLETLTAYWRTTSLADLGRLLPYARDRWARAIVEGGGIYHPGGTLRMGTTARDGVVDGRFTTFAVPNLRVLSTAIFPSGGGANPTLMLMLCALRAVDDLVGTMARHA